MANNGIFILGGSLVVVIGSLVMIMSAKKILAKIAGFSLLFISVGLFIFVENYANKLSSLDNQFILTKVSQVSTKYIDVDKPKVEGYFLLKGSEATDDFTKADRILIKTDRKQYNIKLHRKTNEETETYCNIKIDNKMSITKKPDKVELLISKPKKKYSKYVNADGHKLIYVTHYNVWKKSL